MTRELDKMTIEELLDEKGFDCACGRHHGTLVRRVHIGSGALSELPGELRSLGAKRPFVVCDPDTYEAAGRAVEALIGEHTLCVLRERHPEPDERTLGEAAMRFDTRCDAILAVGTGVINDLCKMLALLTGRPGLVAGTAPSMDGFASNSSSMLTGGVKTSIYNPCPKVIVLDTRILKDAPMRMLWAGLGDMLAKYVSVCEWRITNLVTGEYYCENIASLVRASLRKIMAEADNLPRRDEAAIARVAEGLVMSGVTMSYAGISRPASGVEHYFSHMWDMFALEKGERSDLHGIQVGVGTLLTLKLYEWIREVKPDRARAQAHMRAFDEAAWEREIHRLFGSAAGEVLRIEGETHKNDPARHAARLEKLIAHWDDILKIIDEELPAYDDILSLMRRVGMPALPSEIGITPDQVRDAFVGARDIRDKYMSCSFLWDLGLLDEFGERLRAFAG